MREKNQSKDRWNHFNNMPMQSLLGRNHCLPIFHMAKTFIWIKETKERINEFLIGYTNNPTLNINKVLR